MPTARYIPQQRLLAITHETLGFGADAGSVSHRPVDGGESRSATVVTWTAAAIDARVIEELSPGVHEVTVTTSSGGTHVMTVEVTGTSVVPPSVLAPPAVEAGGEVEMRRVGAEYTSADEPVLAPPGGGPDRAVEQFTMYQGVVGRDYRATFVVPEDVPPAAYEVRHRGHAPVLTVLPRTGGGDGTVPSADADVTVAIESLRCNHMSSDNGYEDEIRLRVFVLQGTVAAAAVDGSFVVEEKKRPSKHQDVFHLKDGHVIGVSGRAEGFDWPWEVFDGPLRLGTDVVIIVPIVWERDSYQDDDDHPDVSSPDWEALARALSGDVSAASEALGGLQLPELEPDVPSAGSVLVVGPPTGVVDAVEPLAASTRLVYAWTHTWEERHRPIGQVRASGTVDDSLVAVPQPLVLTAKTALAHAAAADAAGPLTIRYVDGVGEPRGDYEIQLRVTATPRQTATDPVVAVTQELQVEELSFRLDTANDDRRDNNPVDAVIVLDDGTEHRVTLSDPGARWADRTSHTVRRSIGGPVPVSRVRTIRLETPDPGNDEWHLKSAAVTAYGDGAPVRLVEAGPRDEGMLHRFKESQPVLHLPVEAPR